MAEARNRAVIGAMTGTSMDAIDAVVASVDGTGLQIKARAVRHVTHPLGVLAADLRRAAAGEPLTAAQFAGMALSLGERFADVIGQAASILDGIDLIAVHGQTILHRPPLSWQLLNPTPIAARFDCPVVFDLRQADIVAGGFGAPTTPIADWVLFRGHATTRAIVNLGGYCNVTVIPPGAEAPDSVKGFDVCACNQVLDEVARRALGAPYDEGGAAARRGSADRAAVESLGDLLERQRTADRSMGTGDEAHEWVAGHLKALSAHDLAASAVEAVAACIARAISEHDAGEVVAAGGGVCNLTLLEALARHCPCPVRTSDELGTAPQAREALAMAVVGALSADGVPITLPQVTGRRSPASLPTTWCVPGRG